MMIAPKHIFWICFIAAMIVYATMLAWTIPTITKAAGGNPLFDMRPFGYDAQDAQKFLRALTPDGRQLYISVQLKLDTLYPVLMAISLGLGAYLLSPVRWKLCRWTGAVFAAAGAGFDYLENHFVLEMLRWNTGAIAPDLIQAASRASVLKSVCTTIAITCLVATLAGWFYRRRAAAAGANNGSSNAS
jgi:hypothetical protein